VYWLEFPQVLGAQGAPLIRGKTIESICLKIKSISGACKSRFIKQRFYAFLPHFFCSFRKYTVVFNPRKIIQGAFFAQKVFFES
jgi:hypothetical protein